MKKKVICIANHYEHHGLRIKEKALTIGSQYYAEMTFSGVCSVAVDGPAGKTYLNYLPRILFRDMSGKDLLPMYAPLSTDPVVDAIESKRKI